MVTQRQSKKEGNLKELFAKTPVKKREHTLRGTSENNKPNDGEQVEEDTTLITKLFLEHLFGGLRGDTATFRQEIATTSKELKTEVAELEQRVDTMEHSDDAQTEELDHHREELLTLQENNRELLYQLEDLENRDISGREALKAMVRGQFIALAARANALRKEKRHQLEVRLQELEDRNRGAGVGEARRQLGVVCKELRTFNMDAAEHAMLRTNQMY
ncbi:hypothetical protein NDU88_001493 [Pleurodeles waltl]|uniref:Uncharacterized protein n=1 Tax=Pleurodeles waltl TaxID=8319 RepID=A0AAV7U6K6_PLEWA|nr:hypothetical protein NDU88_001493 [Pleurodeles waltl]